MDREEVTSASEIGDIRPQESTGSCAADANSNNSSGEDSGDSSELLVARPRKRQGRRKRGRPLDTAAGDPAVRILEQGVEEKCTMTDSGAAVDHSDGCIADSVSGSPAPAAAAAAPISCSPDDTQPSSNAGSVRQLATSSSESAATVGGGDVAPAAQPATPTHDNASLPGTPVCPTGRRNRTPSPTSPMPGVVPIVLRTPLTVHSASNSSFASRGLTTPCEVVDVSSRNIAEDVDTADEAEVDITTQVATDAADCPLPPIDAALLLDLERQAHYVADDLTHMMGSMTANLHAMSAVSLRCMESYKESVDDLGVNVDESIKSMYMLIAKCESISNDMKPLYSLADQIKSIKRTLAMFESLCR